MRHKMKNYIIPRSLSHIHQGKVKKDKEKKFGYTIRIWKTKFSTWGTLQDSKICILGASFSHVGSCVELIVKPFCFLTLSQIGLHIATHYQWQSMNRKGKFILCKLIFIWIKILNGIAHNLNWIELNSNLIFKNRIQINAKCIEFVSWLWCWFFFLKRQIWKTPFHSFLFGNSLNNSSLEPSSKRRICKT
jgi:hypothetical protein